MLNTVQLIGNVGSINPADKVVRLNVAVNRNVKQGDGWGKETDWITVTLFGHSADFAKAYVNTGDLVHVEGRIQPNNYEKDGVKVYTYDVIAKRLQKLNRKGDSLPVDDVPF